LPDTQLPTRHFSGIRREDQAASLPPPKSKQRSDEKSNARAHAQPRQHNYQADTPLQLTPYRA